jgi:hypothetical protein
MREFGPKSEYRPNLGDRLIFQFLLVAGVVIGFVEETQKEIDSAGPQSQLSESE